MASLMNKAVMDAIDKRNHQVVFFQMAQQIGVDDSDRVPIGIIRIELYQDICPLTCENFRQFCIGYRKGNAKPIGYKGSLFHRIIRGLRLQGGDFVNGDGTGFTSIYNSVPFDDENFIVKHDRVGVVSMVNNGPNSNGCQFFISMGRQEHMDGTYVAFGQVLDDGESIETIRKIEAVQVPTGGNQAPKYPVVIVECGEL